MTCNSDTDTADLIVVGGGPGGYETALEAKARGMKVIVVERDRLGGTCLNRGCIPTKALCHSAALRLEASAAGCPPTPDFATAARHRDEVVEQLRQGVETLMDGIEVIGAEARFNPDGSVEAAGRTLRAPMTIVATGSAPIMPRSIAGIENAMTSDDLLRLDTLPSSIVIIGGGVIGVEFASVFNAFGVDVTLIEGTPEILPPFDAEVAKRLRMSLKRRGIRIITSACVEAISPEGEVTYTEKGRGRTLRAEAVAVAVGRRPVIPDGLAECGVAIERGAIVVDRSMSTTAKGLWAIGDVTGQCMLAHYAVAQGRVALGLDQKLDPVPSAVFTRPECAMAGLTEQQAIDNGHEISVGRSTFRANGKAVAEGAVDGMVKVIAERSTGRLLGVHICGAHASDLIQTATVAIANGLTAAQLSATIFPHPTLSETLKAALAEIKN